MTQGYPTKTQATALAGQEQAQPPVSTIAYLRVLLAEFFPVGLFALGLLLAIDRFGLILGIVLGSILAGVACWALVRLIAASPVLQWIAAAFVLVEIVFVVLAFV